jgi:hypothetical protein
VPPALANKLAAGTKQSTRRFVKATRRTVTLRAQSTLHSRGD